MSRQVRKEDMIQQIAESRAGLWWLIEVAIAHRNPNALVQMLRLCKEQNDGLDRTMRSVPLKGGEAEPE